MQGDTKGRKGMQAGIAKTKVTKARAAVETEPKNSAACLPGSDAFGSRIDRRSFLGAASALGLSAAVLPIGATGARAAPPKKGGRLRVAITGGHTTDTLDPATFEDAFMQLAGLGCLYNCLTEINAQGNLAPELAESWESSGDAKTWTFKLRQDVGVP